MKLKQFLQRKIQGFSPPYRHRYRTSSSFLHLKQPGLETPTSHINQAICSIVKMGLPPVFIFILKRNETDFRIQYKGQDKELVELNENTRNLMTI